MRSLASTLDRRARGLLTGMHILRLILMSPLHIRQMAGMTLQKPMHNTTTTRMGKTRADLSVRQVLQPGSRRIRRRARFPHGLATVILPTKARLGQIRLIADMLGL